MPISRRRRTRLTICGLLAVVAGFGPRVSHAQPANDNCSGAQTIACNTSITFSNATATDLPSDPVFSCGAFGPAHGVGSLWFRFVAMDTTASLTTCASTGVQDTLIGVYAANPANPCGTLTEIGCGEDSGCGSAGTLSRVCATDLTPGTTYYVQVAGFGPADRGSITLQLQCPCPGNDACTGAQLVPCNSSTPFSNLTASESASDPEFPCSGIAGFATVWFKFVAGSDSALVSVCDRTAVRDTILAVYSADVQNPCGSLTPIGCSDDGCGLGEQLHSHACVSGLTAGATYYVEVAGYNPADRGDMTLDVTCPCSPTCVTCAPGSVAEGEPACHDGYVDQYNGLCSLPLPVLQCGDAFCGTAGTFVTDGLPTRDTDWYQFSLSEEAPITVRLAADFPAIILIVDPDPDCASRTVRATATASACQEGVLSTCLQAGTHWLFVAPSIFDSVGCGGTYAGSIRCQCACPGDMNGDGVADASDIQAFVNCLIVPRMTGCCACADLNGDTMADAQDVLLFVNKQTTGVLCP